MNTYTEKQSWGSTSYTVQEGSHIHFTTEKATIDLITNPKFGRMLFIDGVLQSSTYDEIMYHSVLVDGGLGKKVKRVCIAGGAEGATVREVLKRDKQFQLGIQDIVMVDWDRELVEHMKKEPWAQGSFDDPRVKVIHNDISQFIQSNQESFDTVLIDLLDPNSEEEIQFIQSCIQMAYKNLNPGGKICCNVGGSFLTMNKIRKWCLTNLNLQRQEHCVIEETHVPSFMETWYLLSILKA